MRMLRRSVLLTLIVISLMGCGNVELSKEDAAQIIRDEYLSILGGDDGANVLTRSLSQGFEIEVKKVSYEIGCGGYDRYFYNYSSGRLTTDRTFAYNEDPRRYAVDGKETSEKDFGSQYRAHASKLENMLCLSYPSYSIDSEFESTGIRKLIRLYDSLATASKN